MSEPILPSSESTAAKPAAKLTSGFAAKRGAGHGRNARRRSRELAVQGLYQWFLNPSEVGEVDAHIREAPGFEKADLEHYKALLYGVVNNLPVLTALIEPFIDRPWHELSPVEKSILVLAAQEMHAHLDIPYRVVINEAVELTKSFGGTDAFKFVNGVLDKVAARIRQLESRNPPACPDSGQPEQAPVP